MKLNFIKHSKLWFILSGTLVVLSIVAIALWGLKLGIDFTGGSLMRLEFDGAPLSKAGVEAVFNENPDFGSVTVKPVGTDAFILEFQNVDETRHQEILGKLNEKAQNEKQSQVVESEFETIGPSVGKELREKSFTTIAFVLIAIILYIGWAFRQVSTDLNKYESLRYGLIAIVALVHDILITLGVFAVLGHFNSVYVDTFFIAALLTILGYSVNDTIVIFDRIRENVLRKGSTDFPKVVNQSLNETLGRSINTSFTTLLVLFAVLLFGGDSIFYFILALIIGIISGTYSSLFLASPLLVWWHERRK